MEREIVLSMQNICKSFGPVQVLENVDLQLGRGEVMGLIGENGAGKSTLIKILCGIYHADSGEIILNGKTYLFLLHRQQRIWVLVQYIRS